MNEILQRLRNLFEPNLDNLVQWIDILLVAYLVYRLLSLIRGTRAWRILGGVVIFVIAMFLSDLLHLQTLHWILEKATLLAPVALVLLLLPELRQTLEAIARLGLWPERLPASELKIAARTVEELIAAVAELSAMRMGAIIVVERRAELANVIQSGVLLQAEASAALLTSIFYHGNPLHDGAAVIRGDRVVAAACRLPLSESMRLDPSVHMRHRAGLGVTEEADCLAIIVSEERGTISVASEGALQRLESHTQLRELLNAELRGVRPDGRSRVRRRRERVGT